MDLITTHLNADFDGVASMVAARVLYPGAVLALPAGAQEAVRGFLAVHDLGITRLKEVDAAKITRLILVDAQEADRLGPFTHLCDDPRIEIHLYDHHPARNAGPSGSLVERAAHRAVEPVGATVTLLIERLRAHRHAVTPFDATVLALGLYEETGSLAFSSTTPRDVEAAAWALRAGADLNMVTQTLRRPLDAEQIALLNDLLEHAETYDLDGRTVLLVSSTYDRYRGELAGIVEKLAEMRGVDAVIAAMALENKVEIIGRSRHEDLDVAALCREFGGGGHPVAAAAVVKGRTVPEVREHVADWLRNRRAAALTARIVMTDPAKTAGIGLTIAEVDTVMTKYAVNAVPVVDPRGRYQGIITREIVQKALYHKLHRTLVREFLQTDVFTAAPETPFREVERAMIERNQRFVPVIDAQRVAGVITRTDLLRAAHDDLAGPSGAPATTDAPSVPGRRRQVLGLLRRHVPERPMRLLEQAGDTAHAMGVEAFIVGGFVRDLLREQPNLDLDIVVEGDGIAFAKTLARQWKAAVNIHDRFGTAVLTLPDGGKVDVATARTEYYQYPTALPTVERSSIKKDLLRRDFTINALAIRLNPRRFGELLDFYGGQRDLKDKVIRVLHSLSFVEDPTRVFRAVRFEHRFGFTLGKETASLIKTAVKMELFHRLSGSRLLAELVLLLSEAEPRHAVQRLAELDLLRFITSKLKRPRRWHEVLKPVEDAIEWYTLLYAGRPFERWVVYLMAMLDHVSSEETDATLARLRVPQRHVEKITFVRRESGALLRRLGRRPAPTAAETYRALAGLSEEVLVFLMAKSASDTVKRAVSAYVTTSRHLKPAVSGDDLKALGVKPGPVYKQILDRLLDARLNGDVRTESEERALAATLAGKRSPAPC
jgi:tRNA nucleotidyltransferase (CCA-adding enzyme)